MFASDHGSLGEGFGPEGFALGVELGDKDKFCIGLAERACAQVDGRFGGAREVEVAIGVGGGGEAIDEDAGIGIAEA